MNATTHDVAPPATLQFRPEGIPAELRERDQWVGWRREWDDDRGEWTKIPVNIRTSGKASATDPTTWAPFEDAVRYARTHNLDGVGYVFSAADPYCGVDLDKCRNPESGEIAPWAAKVISDLDTYTELSQSGGGAHAIANATKPGIHCRKGRVEIYDRARYFIMTGHGLPGAPATINPRHAEIDALYAELFPASSADTSASNGHHARADLDNEEIIRRCRDARNGPKFLRLWAGDTSDYGGDDSAADMALVSLLAFWTQDVDQLDRLFRRSGLYRPKWEREDYRRRTIDKAALERDGRTHVHVNRHAAGDGDCADTRPHNSQNPQNSDGDGHSGDSESSGDAPWEEPTELTDLRVPAFPTDVLPDWQHAFVNEEAEATQTPPDLPAMAVIACTAASIAKKVEVLVRDGWTEPMNTYVVTALGSGERKTAVTRDATSPIEDYEAARVADARDTIAREQTDRRIAEQSLARTEKQAAHATGQERNTLILQAEAEAEALAKMTVTTTPCLLADDISPEKVASVLAEQDGRLAILSDEGGIFDLMAGRYSANGTPNLDVFLKTHARGTVRVRRVGRADDHVSNAALTIGLAVQPSVITGLADHPSFRGKGLLARFAYAMPEGTVGHRKTRPDPMNVETRQTYHDRLTELLRIPVPDHPHILALSKEADDALAAFEREIEPRLGEFGDLGHIADWGSKLPGLTARLAGQFHLSEHIITDETPWTAEVSADTMNRAINLAVDYLIPHAVAAFAVMGADPAIADAKYVLRWIARRDDPAKSFTKRDLYQVTKRRFKRVDLLDDPLNVLVRHGYIRKRLDDKPGPGRKPSPTYDVNPLWRPHISRNSQNREAQGNSGDSVNCGGGEEF